MKHKKKATLFNRTRAPTILIVVAISVASVTSVVVGQSGRPDPAWPFPDETQQTQDTTGASMSLLSTGTSGIAGGANWLLTQQDASGWFPWTPGGPATTNTQGPTGQGSLRAYQHDGDSAYLDSAIDTGDYLVPNYPRTYSDSDPRFATHDPLFLELLSLETGDSTYAVFVQTYFWDKLTAGTYGESNDMDAADFGAAVVSGRASQGIVELSPWDLSATAIGAHVAGETAIRDDLMAAIEDGLEATTAAGGYDVIGLAGAVWASAVTGVDLDPTAGIYASDDSTADLATTLAGMTLTANDGAWLWTSTADPTDPTNGDTQTTAFAIMALNAHDRSTYLGQIARGAAFIRSLQQSSGQFLIYPGASPSASGSVESHAEALRALVTVAPPTVYVDDDWATGVNWGDDPDGAGPAIAFGYDAFATIRDGIDGVGNSTVNVAAGTYNESVNVDNFSGLTINGADKTTVIVKPSSTLCWNASYYGCSRQAVFRVVNSTDVVLQNMTMDFDLVKANNVFGILYWDSTGAVNNNILKNMSVSDAAGGYYEFGGYYRAPGYTDASRANITISNNTFVDVGRVAVLTHDYVHAIVTGNTLYKTTDDFGYAIEMGSESTGAIENNTIYGYDTAALSDGSNSAGIYIENAFTGPLFGTPSSLVKNVTVEDNEVYDCQWGLYIGNEFDDYAGDVDINVTLNDNNLHDNLSGGAVITDEDKEHGSSVNVSGGDNSLKDNGDYGYYIYTQGDGDVTVDLMDESITGHDTGVYVGDTGDPSSSSYSVSIQSSNIKNNTTYGVNNTVSSFIVNATYNWWGDASGPYDPSGTYEVLPCNDDCTLDLNTNGKGDTVSDNVDYCPWLGKPTAITLASFSAQAGAGGVALAWETAAEIDNAGFNLYRARSADGPWTRINGALIAAQGDAVSGASYSFLDAPGLGTFYYKLEDVDYYGVSTLHGPVQVTVAPTFRRPLHRPMLPRY